MEATAAAQGKGLIIHPTGNHNADVANLPWSFRIIALSSDEVLHFHRAKTSSEVISNFRKPLCPVVYMYTVFFSQMGLFLGLVTKLYSY